MGYGIIPLFAAVILGIHHVFLSDASWRSKAIVAVLVAASLAIRKNAPPWPVIATLVQVGVGIYLLVRLRIERATNA